MATTRALRLAGIPFPMLLPLLMAVPGAAQQAASPALPEVHLLMREVHEHQQQLNQARENYSYTSMQTTQNLDSNGRVQNAETVENEDTFVNGHLIERAVKKNGQPLDPHAQQKESERVARLVEKAEKTPPDQPLEAMAMDISRVQEIISRVLEIMDVRNLRRETWRGRPTIIFDFAGRKDAKTLGIAEDASKRLQGTLWIDEADRLVAHMEVSFNDNFRVAGGLFASIEKGSNLSFDQALVNAGLWLPTGAEANLQARVLMVKSYRQHLTERDYNFKRSHVETGQLKKVEAPPTRTR
jgi:hypothetical protein